MVTIKVLSWLVLSCCYLLGVHSLPTLQTVLQKATSVFSSSVDSPQYGRFLHLTDIHLDDYYAEGATIKSFCHRMPKKKKKKSKLAGHWGAPGTDCDAAPSLVYHSLESIANEWKDKIDFVLWTGDNARHDSEPGKIRRSGQEILQYNIRMTELMQKHFRRSADNSSIPIVPCLGNNDVHPHNVFSGPTPRPGTDDQDDNLQLILYRNFWADMIPEDQYEAFRHGGYFAVDVARGIRVLSLNTLYFFDSNDAVGSCSAKGEPGYDHVQWMEEQLARAHEDGVKVFIIGHVPPSTRSFKPDCLDAYVNVSLAYKDIIQGHFYGHANADHFQLLHRNAEDDDDSMTIQESPSRLAERLRDQYKELAHHGKDDGHDENIMVVHVAPPLLPLFNPTFRINEYSLDDSPYYGTWTKYTQWYADLKVWNDAYRHGNTSKPQFQVEYATDADYNMSDLSPQSWVRLARDLTEKTSAARDLWMAYLTNMVVQNEDSLNDEMFWLD
ncbi:Metallo-dependent phosphatase [Hesseltinella vesiculosa]|uniref:Metallo-dependent phosphatase n=1 Tax=Hesseltinella vesiculosa TaxID=101127 RepID=A0A1X2GUX8_9FUNG|nr:Metallo-dependent phosphatase [Hesseltinella vesiculosa]